MFTGSPTDPKLDHWLRKQPPATESRRAMR
jgi:hypothetical protein